MKKKILSIVIAFALVLTLLPVTALAADSTAVGTLTELLKAFNAAPTDGTAVTIKMTDNITLDVDVLSPATTLSPPANTNITLDLNGKTLDLNKLQIIIGPSVTFTLDDSANGGTITNGYALYGGAFFLSWGGKFIMDGGTIQNCSATNGTYGGGGVFANNGSTFIMNGGVIRNCTAIKGGGVFLGNDNKKTNSFTMNGGTIENCTATGAGADTGMGGGVFVRANSIFTMHSGTIINCEAARYGGGVSNSGTFAMDGGAIENCTATFGGGGISSDGTVTVSYATITGNVSRGNDGNQIRGKIGQTTINDYCTIENDDEYDLNNVTNAGTKSKIIFNMMGGSGGTDSVDSLMFNAKMPSVSLPTREDCIFEGYFDAAVGGTKYYESDGSATVTAWDKIVAETTLYAHWTQHGVRNITDLEDAESVENPIGFDVFATVGINGGDNYADITYYVSIAWSVDTSGIEFENGALYAWSTEELKYVPVVDKTVQLLGDDTSIDMTITVANRSNAAVSYALSYADHTDDLTTNESIKDNSANTASGTIATADQNGAATAAPGSGHVYSINATKLSNDGNVEQSAVYSGTVTVTGIADGVIITDAADLTLGTYTVTLGAA